MKGNITRRGERSWRLKYDLGRDELTGKRRIEYQTVRGTRRDAERELTAILHSLNTGSYVQPTKLTLADWLQQWLTNHRKRPRRPWNDTAKSASAT